MQTDSSASFTCIASASTVECTATVAMPSSLAARRMRKAISPRLAMRIFSNMFSADQHEGLAKLDRLAVLDEDGGNRPALVRDNIVEGLHGLDEQDFLPR